MLSDQTDYRHYSRNSRRMTTSWVSCLFLGLAFVVGSQLLCSYPITVSADQFTNNKLFTHNRSTSAFDTDVPFYSRLRDLVSTSKRPETSSNNAKGLKSSGSSSNSGIRSGITNSKTSKKNNHKNKDLYRHNNHRTKPNNPNHNYNYYSSSYSIPKSPGDGKQTIFVPTAIPTRINPLAVLKTELNESNSKVPNFGRSNLDDILHEEDEAGRSNELTGAEMSDTNFFKNFRDHAEDPMAQESGGPSTFYTKPDFPMSAQSAPSGTGPTGSVPLNLPNDPSLYSRRPGDQYQSMSNYPTKYPMTGPGIIDGHGQASYSDHKNVNYWPQKLNSYYGDDFTTYYMNHLHSKNPHHKNPAQIQEYGDEGANTNTINRVSMLDRMSTFYTDYKLLAWAGIMILASLSVLGTILVLYWRNPPTEVVLARNSLARRLSDPTLLIFLSEALRKFGDIDFQNGKESGKTKIKRRSRRKKRVRSISGT